VVRLMDINSQEELVILVWYPLKNKK